MLMCSFIRWQDRYPYSYITYSYLCPTLGIFTGHAAIELYAEAFDSVQALDKLEGFLSIHGQRFYNIPGNITLTFSFYFFMFFDKHMINELPALFLDHVTTYIHT